MTIIGKILVFLNLVFALVVAGLVAAIVLIYGLGGDIISSLGV